MIGTQISHFEILDKLGAGGMGEVYRARDTKLGREVALKVLPEAFASDPERMGRFEREAQVLASLNHPHIAAIHGLEEDGERRALVMELVEGETLKERIERGAIPLEQAMRIAVQIAEGLEAAHERGIVHRDLKPANVKITPGEEVKLLDFGLAKALEGEPTADDLDNSPTLTAATRAGVILGTAAYMSPEQAAGEPADRRADIWSFGVVLLEMLTGGRVFSGPSVTHVLASVLKDEPGLEQLPPRTPPRLRELLERCLRKEPKRRLQAIGDARIALEDFLQEPENLDAEVRPADGSSGRGWRRALPWVLFALAAAAVAVLLWWGDAGGRSTIEHGVVRAMVPAPPGTAYNVPPFHPGPVAVSPDGTRLAVVLLEADGRVRLHVRPLASNETRVLSGTDGAGYPFWSPDSRWIGFFSSIDGTLKKVEASGGPPIVICNASNGKGASWGEDGTIVFAPEADGAIHRVSAAGGDPVVVTELDPGRDLSHRHPRFLPGGRHFLYLARAMEGSDPVVMVADLETGSSRELVRSATQAEFGSGHLLFTRDRALMAQSFDPKRLELGGESTPILPELAVIDGAALALFSTSATGVLVTHTGSVTSARELVLRDREGRELGTLGGPDYYQMVTLSPDGSHAAVVVYNSSAIADLHLVELESGLRSRFTFEPDQVFNPVWSRDGQSLYFSARRGSVYDIYRKAIGGVGETELVFSSPVNKNPTSVSPDGRWLLFEVEDSRRRGNTGTRSDIYKVETRTGTEAEPFVATETNEQNAVFSPDGDWVAYVAGDAGPRVQVFVTPFPGPGRKWQLSTEGGIYPQWRADGREIVYVQPDGQLMAVEVRLGTDGLAFGPPQPLFRVSYPGDYGPDFAPSPDGSEFLVSASVESDASSALELVLDWPALVEKE